MALITTQTAHAHGSVTIISFVSKSVSDWPLGVCFSAHRQQNVDSKCIIERGNWRRKVKVKQTQKVLTLDVKIESNIMEVLKWLTGNEDTTTSGDSQLSAQIGGRVT